MRSNLRTPASAAIPFPVESRPQDLPIAQITWENFERLCVRLVEKQEEIEQCHQYGERGDSQEGIDIYARRRNQDRYDVYQCKNVGDFGPALIKAAVTTFLVGEWAERTATFTLCTRESMTSKLRQDAIVVQAALLGAKQIGLTVWDSHYFARVLKEHPDLVDDFFGRAWVTAFCGEDAAKSLGERLDVGQVAEYRQRLRTFYHHFFNTLDPGLPNYSLSAPQPLSLEERFVKPDIYVQRSIPPVYSSPQANRQNEDGQLDSAPKPSHSSEMLRFLRRQGLENRLIEGHRHVILAPVGGGKSALLRFITLDQLLEIPTLTRLAEKWNAFLPVWVPFASWTRLNATTTGPCSLHNFLEKWFEGMDASNLWPLVNKALSDDRLLLLVDGLDEYADEQIGRSTLRQLEVFIAVHSTPSIVTGRPDGFRRLEMQTVGWQIGEVAELTPGQQRQIALQWFMHRANPSPPSSVEERERVQSLAEAQVDSFLAELSRANALKELARTPLLLNLLISHRFFHAALPLTRTKAYESLVNLLLREHPKRRREVEASVEKSSTWSEDVITHSLAYLAYRMQITAPEGIVSANEIEMEIETYLRDEEIGYGYALAQARTMSRSFLTQCSDEYGLLVKRSVSEIAFYHRAFQEYLAAYHLSRMPFPEPRDLLLPFISDPRWREVILNFFQILNRPQEVQRYLDVFEPKLEELGPVDCEELSTLIYEIALGPYNCPPRRAHNLIERAFQEIEAGDWLPRRERILALVLEGVASATVGEAVQARLKRWFPCSLNYVGGIYDAMRSWPELPEVDEVLWYGVRSEKPNDQRGAAFALASRLKGDSTAFERMKLLVQRGESASVRAAALLALNVGWAESPDLSELAESAIHSAGLELRMAGIYVKARLGVRDDNDLQELLHIGKHLDEVDYDWRYLFANILIKNWSGDVRVKEACLAGVNRSDRWRREGIEEAEAFRILIWGFPQDNDVARLCAEHIESDVPSHFMHDANYWTQLAENFPKNAVLSPVIEAWLLRQCLQKNDIPQMSQGALLVRSTFARDILRTCLTGWTGHWASGALLEGWGMEDETVAQELTALAYGADEQAIFHAHLFPRIIVEPDACRKRLLSLLKPLPSPMGYTSVLYGLAALGETEGDSEVVNLLLPLLVLRQRSIFDSTLETLIGNYSTDSRVRTLALSELAVPNGYVYTVARRYGDDKEIRTKLLEKMGFLPTELRRQIASHFIQAAEDVVALPLLQGYKLDPDTEVRNNAAIAYHHRLKANGLRFEEVASELEAGVDVIGLDFEQRRQSALCGMLTWERLEFLRQPDGADNSNPPKYVPVHSISRESPALAASLAKHWAAVKESLGDQRWRALSAFGSRGKEPIGNVLSLFADEHEAACNEVLSLLEDGHVFDIRENMLAFLARIRPGSRLLLDHSLRALSIGEDRSIEANGQVVIAAQILGEQYGGDKEVLEQLLERRPYELFHPGIIVALCEGWPDSSELEEVYQITRQQGRARWDYSWTAYIQMVTRKSRPEVIVQAIQRMLSQFEFSGKYAFRFVVRPLARRLSSDDNLLNICMGKLGPTSSPSEKATFARLIGEARGVSAELRSWALDELTSQQTRSSGVAIGIDLVAQRVQPLTHSLLSLLARSTIQEIMV